MCDICIYSSLRLCPLADTDRFAQAQSVRGVASPEKEINLNVSNILQQPRLKALLAQACSEYNLYF